MTTVSGVTKHWLTAQEGFTTTTSGSVSSGAATVGLNSVSGYANGEVVVFVIDPTDTNKKQAFTGTIDTSGVQVTGVVWTEGTNQTHAAGATVVDYETATGWAMLAKGLKVSHDDDGTLKAGAVDVAAVLASDVVTTAKILDANVTTAKIADDNVTAAKIDWASTGANAGIWWEELGRTTLGSAGDAISVASLPARKYLMVIASCLATGGTIRPLVRFNNDTASNYANRHSVSGAADSTNVSQSAANTTLTATAQLHNVVLNVVNIAAQEKTVTETIVSQGTSGAGNAPIRIEGTFKWANTADQITRVDLVNDGTGDFATGSEVLVLGHN